MLAQYRRWFDYEKDVHRLALASLETVPASARTDAEFQRAVDLLAHLIAARRMWLFRFGVTADKPELFPKAVAFDSLASDLEAMESQWDGYLSTVDQATLDRPFEYTSYEGKRFRNTVSDILTQLFGHSWYHRGQIAQTVRRLGGTPAITDFVFWSREAI
jgi:uncharacterized damage-inducible protein DinB